MSDEPVDLVFTWVDGRDPEWQKLKRSHMSVEQAAAAASDDENLGDDKRYRNMEEISYAVRAANLYAPWLRTIFIVITDGQKLPAAVLATPNVVVVPYSTIMPAAILPSFCSTSIEAHLHNIPGLSEVFLNGDDDYFFWKPTPKSHFVSDGELHLRGYHQPEALARLGLLRRGHMRMANHSAMLLYARGFAKVYMPEHSFHVFRKSTCKHVWAELHAELTESCALKFRDENRCLIWQLLVYAYEDQLHHPVHELALSSQLSFNDAEDSKLIRGYVLARLFLLSRYPPYTTCFNTISPSWYDLMHRYFSMHLGKTPRAAEVLQLLRTHAPTSMRPHQTLATPTP